jgi:hypothetical protein
LISGATVSNEFVFIITSADPDHIEAADLDMAAYQ